MLSTALLLLVACDGGLIGEDPLPWEFDDVFGLPNLDDDNGDRDEDWTDGGVEEENDFTSFTVSQEIVDSLGDGESIRLTLEGDTDDIRVWQNGNLRLGEGATTETEVSPSQALTLEVEFSDFLVEGTLTIARLDSEGAVSESASVVLQASPMLFNHHLQTAETVYAVESSGIGGNRPFIEAYQDALGEAFVAVPGQDYSYDPWIQDEIEFGYMAGAEHHVDVVFDTIRDRPLDGFAEDYFDTPDFPVMVWGSGRETSQDYGGNLEISPPVTVDGVDYPVGRFYYGEGGGNLRPNEEVRNMLRSQAVQDPFVLDISFLCVGHVDEYISFVPDSTSAKGFKMVVGDAAAGMAFVDSIDASHPLPKYRRLHGVSTVGELQDEQHLRNLQAEIQEDHIEPAIEVLKTELGLTDDDIVRIPALYEEAAGCQTWTAALIPGTANLIAANMEGEATRIFAADPFFRATDETQDDDPFIAEIERLLPAELEWYWLDDWSSYHALLGEVHCGTNVIRTPPERDWTQGLHLLDGEEN